MYNVILILNKHSGYWYPISLPHPTPLQLYYMDPRLKLMALEIIVECQDKDICGHIFSFIGLASIRRFLNAFILYVTPLLLLSDWVYYGKYLLEKIRCYHSIHTYLENIHDHINFGKL